MASQKEWLQPGCIVNQKVFGESRIVAGDTPAGWVKFQYKMYTGHVGFEWSSIHTEHENYFTKPSK